MTLSKGLQVIALVFLVVVTRVAYGEVTETAAPSDAANQKEEIEIKDGKSSASSGEVKLNKEYFKGYLTDTKNILTSPARWDTTDWVTFSLVTGAAVGIYFSDDKIMTWVQDNKNNKTEDFVKGAKKVGRAALPALAAFGIYGYAFNDSKAVKTVLLSVESFVITGVFVQTLKFSTHRHRPYTGDPYNTWDGPSFSNEGGHLSFPSGDASSAFAVASVVASEYNNIVVPILTYGAAAAISYGRVHDQGHWTSDVFVGAAIGFFTGKAVVNYHEASGSNKISFVPMVDAKNIGGLLTYRF